MTRSEQVAVNELHRMLGELTDGQRSRGQQMDRIESKVDQLTTEHAKTREMVVQHRTGMQFLMWLGGAALAVLGAVKGLNIGSGK